MVQRQKIKLGNVLVVCYGNICRSPLVGAILATHLGRDQVRDRGFVNPGKPAAKKIREFACSQGYDLVSHKSALVIEEDIEWCSTIVHMGPAIFRRLEQQFNLTGKIVVNLGYMVGLKAIPDPNYLPRGPKLATILDQIVVATQNLLEAT